MEIGNGAFPALGTASPVRHFPAIHHPQTTTVRRIELPFVAQYGAPRERSFMPDLLYGCSVAPAWRAAKQLDPIETLRTEWIM